MKKSVILLTAAVLAAVLAGCSGASSAPESKPESAVESSAVSMLAEQPTAEEVVAHIESSKPAWTGRTITCAFDPEAKTVVTTIAVHSGRKLLDRALTTPSNMESWSGTMGSYAKFNEEIRSYLVSGGYDGFDCSVLVCEETDPADVLTTIDDAGTITIREN